MCLVRAKPGQALWSLSVCVCVVGGGGWHKASVCGCLPLAAPIGLSPLLILTVRTCFGCVVCVGGGGGDGGWRHIIEEGPYGSAGGSEVCGGGG